MAIKRYLPALLAGAVALGVSYLMPDSASALGASLVEQGLTMVMVLPPHFSELGAPGCMGNS
ncbi:MAG: hypothetical protein GW949_08530 [Spirochaetales bacterium]|nr:hypothetical protein [Spirochaetales bacterium]